MVSVRWAAGWVTNWSTSSGSSIRAADDFHCVPGGLSGRPAPAVPTAWCGPWRSEAFISLGQQPAYPVQQVVLAIR